MRERLLVAGLFVGLFTLAGALAGAGVIPTGIGALPTVLVALCMWLVAFVHASQHGTQPRLLAAGMLWILQVGLGVGALRIATLALTLDEHTLAAYPAMLVPLALLTLAAMLTLVYAGLDRHALEPSPAAKLGVAFVGLALGCTCLATGLEWAHDGGVIASAATIGCVLSLLIAVALAGPACLRALLDALPTNARGVACALGLLALLCSHSLASLLALPRTPAAAFGMCLTLGFAGVAAALLGSFTWRPMLALTHASPNEGPGPTLVGRPAHPLDATR